MKNRARHFTFTKGLSTTSAGAMPDEFSTFQNVETDLGQLDVRKGRVRIGTLTNSTQILDADGADDKVAGIGGATFIPLTTSATPRWTIETLFKTDSIAADSFIVGRTSATATGITIKHTTTSTVVVTVTDSAAAAVTLTFTGIGAGVLCGLQVKRDGATLTGWLNGTTVTGTMSATLDVASGNFTFFADNGASFYNGGIDYFRLWTVARSTRRDIYHRLLNPRHKDVRFDWVFVTDSVGDIQDRGRFGAHLVTAGSPAFTKDALCLNAAMVQGIAYNVRKNGSPELIVANGGRHSRFPVL